MIGVLQCLGTLISVFTEFILAFVYLFKYLITFNTVGIVYDSRATKKGGPGISPFDTFAPAAFCEDHVSSLS